MQIIMIVGKISTRWYAEFGLLLSTEFSREAIGYRIPNAVLGQPASGANQVLSRKPHDHQLLI